MRTQLHASTATILSFPTGKRWVDDPRSEPALAIVVRRPQAEFDWRAPYHQAAFEEDRRN